MLRSMSEMGPKGTSRQGLRAALRQLRHLIFMSWCMLNRLCFVMSLTLLNVVWGWCRQVLSSKRCRVTSLHISVLVGDKVPGDLGVHLKIDFCV